MKQKTSIGYVIYNMKFSKKRKSHIFFYNIYKIFMYC